MIDYGRHLLKHKRFKIICIRGFKIKPADLRLRHFQFRAGLAFRYSFFLGPEQHYALLALLQDFCILIIPKAASRKPRIGYIWPFRFEVPCVDIRYHPLCYILMVGLFIRKEFIDNSGLGPDLVITPGFSDGGALSVFRGYVQIFKVADFVVKRLRSNFISGEILPVFYEVVL